ncbi:hypothetical protein [Haloplanus salinarum]|uniref:hypothetical protein n=1 Tax=Haloplanus salinarum TaxID=1912324 RepID=UPI00214BFEF5|nr:hypothetical protein [Haloplanus salinarum]
MISCIAPTAPALAQETNTSTPTVTPTPTDAPSNASAELVIDETLRITEWSYRGGTFIITFHSDTYQSVSLTAVPESSGSGASAGTVNYRERNVQPDAETEVRIDVPQSGGRARVWIFTSRSAETGEVHYLEAGRDSSLLSGPFDGSDVRDGAIGGASGVGFAVLYTVARAKLGADQEGERLA